VFAGTVNNDQKLKVLEELAKSDSKHFLILFRDHKCQYRGLYSWDQMSDTAHKVQGSGPRSCKESTMQLMFKSVSRDESIDNLVWCPFADMIRAASHSNIYPPSTYRQPLTVSVCPISTGKSRRFRLVAVVVAAVGTDRLSVIVVVVACVAFVIGAQLFLRALVYIYIYFSSNYGINSIRRCLYSQSDISTGSSCCNGHSHSLPTDHSAAHS
jgi:hypothetical protein